MGSWAHRKPCSPYGFVWVMSGRWCCLSCPALDAAWVSALLATSPKSCLSVFPVTSDSLCPLSHLNRSSCVSIRVTGINPSVVSVISLLSSHSTLLSGCVRHSGCSLHVPSESSLAPGEARDTSCLADNRQENLNKRRARQGHRDPSVGACHGALCPSSARPSPSSTPFHLLNTTNS